MVGVASTSEEALRRVEDVKPDVVLIDVDLGDESGFNLARQFQSETSLDPSRVILISTYAEEDLRDLITAAPVAAFLSKSRISARAIHQILGDTGAPNPPTGV